MDGAHRRTLERALTVLESKERLAAALELPVEEIDLYIAGTKPLPQQAFIAAIDIVANGNRRT
jgi:hypothetical protein